MPCPSPPRLYIFLYVLSEISSPSFSPEGTPSGFISSGTFPSLPLPRLPGKKPPPQAYLAELPQLLPLGGVFSQGGQELQQLGAGGGGDVQEGGECLLQRAGGQAALRDPQAPGAWGEEPAVGAGQRPSLSIRESSSRMLGGGAAGTSPSLCKNRLQHIILSPAKGSSGRDTQTPFDCW